MSAPRAAALLIGFGLLGGLGAVPARAAESSAETTAPESVSAPGRIPAVLSSDVAAEEANNALETELRPTEAAASAQTPDPTPTIDPALPGRPDDATPNAADPEAALPNISPPDLPNVVVAVPTPEPVAAALTALYGGQLHPRLAAGRKRRSSPSTRSATSSRSGSGRAWTAPAQAVLERLAEAERGRARPGRLRRPGLGVGARQARRPRRGRAQARARRRSSTPASARGADRPVPPVEADHAEARPAGRGRGADRLAAARDPGAALEAYNPPQPAIGPEEQARRVRANRPCAADGARAAGPGPAGRHARPARAADPRRASISPNEATRPPMTSASPPRSPSSRSEKGLPRSGVLTAQTVAALAAPARRGSKATSIANMERWRWLPRDLGARHIAVNMPEYRLRVCRRTATWCIRPGSSSASPRRRRRSSRTRWIRHRQSVLERAALDPQERVPARLADDPDYAARARLRGRSAAAARSRCASRRASAMRSASSSSCSRTSTRSICTTRRTASLFSAEQARLQPRLRARRPTRSGSPSRCSARRTGRRRACAA